MISVCDRDMNGPRRQQHQQVIRMYEPPHFREDRIDVQHGLIRAHPLGLLVSAVGGEPVANAVPFILDAERGPKGALRAHVARANAQYESLRGGATVLAVFQGADAYVTPSWYASKKEHGKVVPTWNYAMVQVRGTVEVIEDPAWIARQIRDLTFLHENPRPAPWAVDDAPPQYIAAQLRGIVGLDIAIAEISGKWKVSQNVSTPDRAGVASGLEDPAMAALVRSYGGIEDAS